MYNKTLLAVVVATGIAIFIISGSFHDIYGRKLSYLTNSATAAIKSTRVGGSILKGVSNSSISTGQSSSNTTSNSILKSNDRSNNNDNKVILSFDGRKGDFTYAKPILDKYGFKATFFIICGKTTDRGAMNWQDIAALQKDGMDIESHTMTHPHLNTLNQNQLDYQIGGSKQCLASHGYNSTIFAYPCNSGQNDQVVVNTVAKYYNIGRTGTQPLMFLNCNGFRKEPQIDCIIDGSDGKLNYANRYEARSLSFDVVEIKDSFNNIF
jgi:peptidoglycan/xylan/chitin deacetylase (PgdA/CDA1 family)